MSDQPRPLFSAVGVLPQTMQRILDSMSEQSRGALKLRGSVPGPARVADFSPPLAAGDVFHVESEGKTYLQLSIRPPIRVVLSDEVQYA